MTLFHEPKICQWVHAPGLRSLTWRTTSRRKNQGLKSKKNMVAVQTIMLDQNEDEVVSLKIYKEHPWIFAYNGMICSY